MIFLPYFPDIWRCMRFVFDNIFNKVLLLVSAKTLNEEKEKELEHHAQFLLVKFNHMQEKIRRVADKYLSLLVDK